MPNPWLRWLPMLSGCLSMLLGGTLAFAEDSRAALAPIVVTATRIAETADQTLAPVSVVTREDIERMQASSLRDVLRGLPGVAIANQGGRGKLTSLFLRGAESNHVLVLIDGIKVGDATTGQFRFEDMPVELIERIEVVRGPRASLYGSDAIGGVIQIFTHKGGGATDGYGRVGAGSRGGIDAGAGISGGGNQGWFNVTGNSARADGINARDVALASEPDRDGFRNSGVSARAGYRFENDVEIEGLVLRNRNDTEFDGSFVNESAARQTVYAGKLKVSPLAGWRMMLNAGQSDDEYESFKNGVFMTRFATRRDDVLLQNDIGIGEAHVLTVGVDYRRDRVSGTTDYAVGERDNKGFFTQFLAALGDHDLQLAGRYDDNQQFGSTNTGGIAWGWKFLDAVRFTASYGTAFQAPTFNDLYSPYGGNRALAPEESETFDLGLSGHRGSERWSVNVFRTEVENLIEWRQVAPGRWTPSNVGEVRIDGLEVNFGTRVFEFDVNSSLTLLDARNLETGGRLLRRPGRVLRLDVDRTMGRYRLGATMHDEGARLDFGDVRLGSFYTGDLRAAYQVFDSWSVEGKIENVLDHDYETVSGYNQPGFGFFVTLRYQP